MQKQKTWKTIQDQKNKTTRLEKVYLWLALLVFILACYQQPI